MHIIVIEGVDIQDQGVTNEEARKGNAIEIIITMSIETTSQSINARDGLPQKSEKSDCKNSCKMVNGEKRKEESISVDLRKNEKRINCLREIVSEKEEEVQSLLIK